MDDQPGNVIDGTARARHWSRPRPNTAPTDGDGTEARNDAPKSIAASLLVPADMLPVASPVDERPKDDQDGGAAAHPHGPAVVVADAVPAEDTPHQNPFLAPEAAAGSAASSGQPAGRRSIAALLTRAIGAVNWHRRSVSAARRLVPVTPIRRLLAVRSIRLLAVALAAAAAIGVTVVILTGSSPAVSPSAHASLQGGNVSSLDGRKSAPLAAAASPFPATHATRRSTPAHPRRVHRHQTSSERPNRTHATGATQPASSTAAVAASYTPPPTTNAGTTSSSDISGTASSSPSAPAAQPAAQPSSAPGTPSTPSTPAFGSSGALAPGSSPNG
jgi:hypothetical protein